MVVEGRYGHIGKSAIVALSFVLALPFAGRALSLSGLKAVGLIETPATPFYGSLSVVMDESKGWLCNLGNDYILEVIPWNTVSADEYWEPAVKYRLYRGGILTKDSECVAENTLKSPHKLSGFSVTQSPSGIIVSGNDGVNIFQGLLSEIPPLKTSSEITVYGYSEKAVRKLENNFICYPVKDNIDVDSLDFEVFTSPHAGFWKYLDRVTPADGRATVGGRYGLAIVEDPDNCDNLLLVYLDGADVDSQFWHCGDIKGRMKPTGFEDHYDVEWYDVHGFEAGMMECSANFEGYNLLTVDFPLLRCQIRFQRIEDPRPNRLPSSPN